MTTFELPDVRDMFTVYASRGAPDSQDLMHSYLLTSRPDGTMVLQTGQEINEVDQSGFDAKSPTILAANVGNNKYIAQVRTSLPKSEARTLFFV